MAPAPSSAKMVGHRNDWENGQALLTSTASVTESAKMRLQNLSRGVKTKQYTPRSLRNSVMGVSSVNPYNAILAP